MDKLQFNVNHYGQYMTVNISDYANVIQYFVSDFNIIDDERVITQDDISNIIKQSNCKFVPNFIVKKRKDDITYENVDKILYKHFDEESLSNYLTK